MTSLPPLPKSADWVCVSHSEFGISTTMWRPAGQDYYTADQMRAYALAALAAGKPAGRCVWGPMGCSYPRCDCNAAIV
jgi:hypothetical protein